MKRVAVFVDGFNLYHSLAELETPRLKWLDLKALAQRFVRADETLVQVTYFTALSTWDENKQIRHKRYIRALTLSGVSVVYGRFKNRTQTCSQCGFRYKGREEKRTDVNIAVALLTGAVRDDYDTAILVSGDTDLIPALHAVRALSPLKRMGILFPLNRHTGEMEQAADFSETIRADIIESCRLPDRIRLPSGKYLTPPEDWA